MINILLNNVDWKNTRAFAVDQNLIYIIKNDEKEKIQQELIDELRNTKNINTNENLVNCVMKKEEVFNGDFMHLLPDLIIMPEEGYRFVGFPRDDGTKKIWDDSIEVMSGWHRLQGVFLANGPKIKKGVRLAEVTIYDVAPTILHILGVPIPQEIDGRVLREIFEDDSDIAGLPIKFRNKMGPYDSKEKDYYSDDEEKLSLERLKRLGYV
jgi:predicted AlkP superfamily phosphohydrolase/phosphomutase